MTPAGFIAVLAGWYTTEIGRQPYVIYGLMRTDEAAERRRAQPASSTSLVAFATVYLFVFIAGTYYLLKLLRKGPQPVEQALLHPRRQDARCGRCPCRRKRVGNAPDEHLVLRRTMDTQQPSFPSSGSPSSASACSCTC